MAVFLKKLYSNSTLFNPIKFERGVNIIVGKYFDKSKEDSNLNGIGKSTLIRLVDYMLASDSGKKIFDPEEHEFLSNEIIFLDIIVGNEVFTIKRNLSENDKIYFGKKNEPLIEYSDIESRKIFGNLFFGEYGDSLFIENKRFRDLIRFYVKDDLENFERKDALNFSSSYSKLFDTYSLNLYLMGLKNEAVYKFSIIKDKSVELGKQKRRQITRLKEETGKAYEEVSSEIIKIQNKIDIFEKSLQDYKFMDSYEEIEESLISISQKVSPLLSKHSHLTRKLEEYKESYEYSIEVNPNEISKQYSELKQEFGEIIKRKIEDVLEFRKTISDNRKIFLKQKEVELEIQIKEIRGSINELEKSRVELYQKLEEKNALDELKNTYSQLIEEKAKKQKFDSAVNSIKNLDDEITILSADMIKEIAKIKKQIDSCNGKIANISKMFFDLVEKILGKDVSDKSIFSILPSSSKKSPLSINLEIPKVKSLGKSRFKIVLYDLLLFLNSIESGMDFPKFLFHDGVFHGIDIKTTSNTLNYLEKFSLEHDLQYIITANEGELHIEGEESMANYDFDIKGKIIAKYSDKPAEMFFKREFD